MTGILKAEQLSSNVRALSAFSNDQGNAPDFEVYVSQEQLLRAELAAYEAELAEFKAGLPAILAAEFDRGRKVGIQERDQSAAKKLAAVEAGLVAATKTWVEELKGMNALAVEICRSVLGRMIGNPDWRSELIREAIDARVSQLDHSCVMDIRVSSADFPQVAAAPAFEANGIKVRPVENLSSGQCIFDLKMGQHDLGPDAQWARIAALLDQLSDEAGRPC